MQCFPIILQDILYTMRYHLNIPYLTDLVSVCVIALFAYPVLRYAETANSEHLAMLAGMLSAEVVTKVVKRMTAESPMAWLKRPHGATGCDILCAGADVSGAPGFPSGHVTAVSFFFTYLICNHTRTPTLLLLLLGCGGILAVAASRVIKRCHTPLQVTAGAMWGFVAAVVTRHVSYKL